MERSKKKYICEGGWVTSRRDGDRHYVNSRTVAKLYNAPLGACFFHDEGQSPPLMGEIWACLTILRPRYDGNYQPVDSRHVVMKQEFDSVLAEAGALHSEISKKGERLKELKTIIAAHAQARIDALVVEPGKERPKSVWLQAEGCKVKVAFPSPSLEKVPEGSLEEQARTASGEHFKTLFEKVTLYKPVKGFRELAAALLKKKAWQLLGLVEKPKGPEFEFEAGK